MNDKPTPVELDSAFKAGNEAAMAGKSRSSCPFSNFQQNLHFAWLDGWDEWEDDSITDDL